MGYIGGQVGDLTSYKSTAPVYRISLNSLAEGGDYWGFHTYSVPMQCTENIVFFETSLEVHL